MFSFFVAGPASIQSKRAYTFLAEGEEETSALSYLELDQQARAIGAWLQSVGARGERVLLLYPPGLDYITAFFGCLYAGAVAVTAYPPKNNRNIARLQAIVSDAGAKAALTTASILFNCQDSLRTFAGSGEVTLAQHGRGFR